MSGKEISGKYLITTDNWFYAPDGKQYRVVWGEVKILTDTILGVKTNRSSSNWFARVGTEEDHVVVAGCQIHYAVRSEHPPHTGPVEESSGRKKYRRLGAIYLTE